MFHMEYQFITSAVFMFHMCALCQFLALSTVIITQAPHNGAPYFLLIKGTCIELSKIK